MAVKFTPIVAKSLNINEIIDELRAVTKREAKFADTQFGLTYKTFKHKPTFRQRFKETKNKVEASTLTSDEGSSDNPYPFMKGTRPHIIRPVRAKALVFRAGYTAKTTPRVIGSKSGGSSGPVVYAQEVRHPGTKDREFEQEIAKREQPKFKRRGQKAIDDAARRSKHAI